MKQFVKIIGRTHCFIHQSTFRPNYIFNNNGYFFLEFYAQTPFDLFYTGPIQQQQDLQLGILNFEKQHKEGFAKIWDRPDVFSTFHADFVFAPNQ